MKKILKEFKKEIALGVCGILLVCVVFSSVKTVSNASALKEVKAECKETIAVNAKKYLSGYSTTSTETMKLEKNGVDTSSAIASAVSETVVSSIHSTNLTEEQMQEIFDAIDKTIEVQLATMGHELSEEEEAQLKSGIQTIAITTVYKAIADRGLVTVENMNSLRKGIEERVLYCEQLVNQKALALEKTLSRMQSSVGSIDTDATNNAHRISELNEELLDVMEQLNDLPNSSADGTISDEDLASIQSTLSGLLEDVIDAEEMIGSMNENLTHTDANNELLMSEIITLKETIVEIQNGVGSGEGGGLSDEALSELRGQIGTLSTSLEERISLQTQKIDTVNADLDDMEEGFNAFLTEYSVVQSNTDSLLSTLTENVGEGSVDARITALCNEIAIALGADISQTNDSLNAQMNSLSSSLSNTNNSVSGLTTELKEVEVSLASINDEQAGKLTKAVNELNSAIEASELSMSSSLTNVKDSLESLISGNTADIGNLVSELSASKSELENQLASADEETKAEIQAVIDSMNEVNTQLQDDFALQIAEAKSLAISLNEEQKTALSEATASLTSKLEESETELSASMLLTKNSLEELINGNSSDITGLAENIETAKSELQAQMETADEEQKAELEAMISDLDTILTELDASVTAQLASTNETMLSLNEEQTQALTAAKSALEEQLANVKTELSGSITTATDSLNELIDGNSSDITELSGALTAAKSDLVLQMETADEEQKAELQGLIDTLDTALETLTAATSQKDEELEASVLDLSTNLSSTKTALEDAKTTLTNRLATLNSTLEGATGDISTLQTDVTQLTNTATENIEKIEAVSGRVTANEAAIETVGDKAEENASNISTINGKLTSQENDLSAVKSKTDTNTTDISTLNSNVSSIQSSLDDKASTTEVESIDDRLDNVESTKAEMKYSTSGGTPTITITCVQ